MKTVKLKAPATIANLVCGFDVLGMCVTDPYDEMEITVAAEKRSDHQKWQWLSAANRSGLQNTAGAPLLEMLKEMEEEVGFEVIIYKHIKPGSGLGSSAASAAGAVVGANHLLQNRFTKNDLVRFALFGEKVASGVKHADNIAPCIFGGVTLSVPFFLWILFPLTAPPLFISIVHPQIEIKTADARQILRKDVLLKDAIRQWGNMAGLVAGFMKGDYDLIGRSLEDVIIEPLRSILIPGFEDIKKASYTGGCFGRWHFRIRPFPIYVE